MSKDQEGAAFSNTFSSFDFAATASTVPPFSMAILLPLFNGCLCFAQWPAGVVFFLCRVRVEMSHAPSMQ